MSQTIPVDVPLGPGATGLAIGATVYALDGTTVIDAFSVIGWYEAPAGSGSWHHPGLTLSDAGAVVAVGVALTEWARASVGAKLIVATPSDVTTAQAAIIAAIAALNNLSSAQAQAAATAALNAYDPPTKAELDAAQAAILAGVPAANVIVAAIMAYAVDTGVPLSTALQKIFAIIAGSYLGDDPEATTNIIYYAPDGVTPRVEFDYTTTTREPV